MKESCPEPPVHVKIIFLVFVIVNTGFNIHCLLEGKFSLTSRDRWVVTRETNPLVYWGWLAGWQTTLFLLTYLTLKKKRLKPELPPVIKRKGVRRR